MTQKMEHSWNEWDYKNRRTPIWVMMLTSASCCRHVQQDSACSFSVRQDSDIRTQGTAPVYVIDMSEEQITREDVKRRRHVLLRCEDFSLNHEWSKTAPFVSCLDVCLDAVGVRPLGLLYKAWRTLINVSDNMMFVCAHVLTGELSNR
jgi:ribosomal protein L39E